MPHGHINNILEENKLDFDWLTRDTVNSAYTRYKKRLDQHSEEEPDITEIHLNQRLSTSMSDLSESRQNSNSYRKSKGGRPSGSLLAVK